MEENKDASILLTSVASSETESVDGLTVETTTLLLVQPLTSVL